MNDQTSTALAGPPARDNHFKLGNCIIWSDAARCVVSTQAMRGFLLWHRDGEAGEAGGMPESGKPFRSVFTMPDGTRVSIETDAARVVTSLALAGCAEVEQGAR
jgi:hypothetical protein